MLESILSLFLLQAPSVSNYDNVLKKMDEIYQMNPVAVQIITIGSNNQGQAIKGFKIGNGPVSTLVVATHHGNEYGSTAVALGFAQSLALKPIENQTVYVIPALNIPGYNKKDRYEPNGARAVDPNRDYPSPCKKGQNFLLRSTEALAQLIDEKNIVTSATLHTYYPGVLHPWGISTTDLSTPYDDTYKALGQAATIESGYAVGNSTEMLYAADGAFEDYAYWKHGIWSLLFEMGFSHNPDQTSIKNMIEVNVPGLRRFLEQAPTARAPKHDFTGRCDSRAPQRILLE